MLSASTLDPHNSSDHTQLISNNWLLSTNDVTQDSVLAVFDMSPELILVPRAFIILVSVGDRSPTLTRTRPERSKLWEREWSPELKEVIKEFTAMWGWNSRIFFLFYNFATQMKLLWRGNLREAELMRNRDFPQFLTKTNENSRNHPPGSRKLLRNKQTFWRTSRNNWNE